MPEPADLSRDAVFVRSTNAALHFDTLRAVAGPSGEQLRSLSASLQQYAAVGYQASHFAQAAALCGRMLVPQPPSAPVTQAVGGGAGGDAAQPAVLVQPTIFLGAAANLFGTGCREAIRFLCAESVPLPDGVLPAATPDEISVASCDKKDPTASLNPPFCSRALIHALVVSGGAMEHDIRRACEPYQIMNRGNAGGTLSNLRDEKRKPPQVFAADESEEVVVVGGKFGNITYGGGTALTPCMFASVMRRFVSRLIAEQQKQKAACEARPIPDAYNDTCLWAFCPSTVWYLAGRWLPDLFAEVLLERNAGVDKESVTDEAQQRAESTVVYWAAKNGLPVFSPSFADGDIIKFILEAEKSTPATMFRLDLVVDIHRLNKFAMRSQRTGMIILGGGVVKHHVCNANLMRNGADYAVFINNGQEFDGSDAGARPDEAISWGKVRLDGDYVKVYAEVSLVFPLLVAQVFLPWVRAARGMSQTESNAKSVQ